MSKLIVSLAVALMLAACGSYSGGGTTDTSPATSGKPAGGAATSY